MAQEPSRGGPMLVDAILRKQVLLVAGAILLPGTALLIAGAVLFIIYT